MGDRRVVVEDLPAVAHGGIEKAIDIQHSAVVNYVQRLRRGRPSATPAELITRLEKRYLTTVTGAGAALGGVAAVPGGGTGLAVALSAGETALFLETTTLFALAVAEVHAVRLDGVEPRRRLLLTVVLGDGGSLQVEKVAGNAGEHWGRLLADLIPMSSVSALNKALCHGFLARYPRSHGALVLGRLLPFGIGAGIGALGNHAFGRMVINASRRVFGPPPAGFATDGVAVRNMPRQALASILGLEAPAPASLSPESLSPESLSPESLSPESPAAEHPARDEAAAPETATRAAAAGAGPVTGKYRPLFDYLAAQRRDRVEVSFSDIAALVSGGLPRSAATRTWWGNSAGSRQAKAWLAAGYRVAGVDLRSRTVRFER